MLLRQCVPDMLAMPDNLSSRCVFSRHWSASLAMTHGQAPVGNEQADGSSRLCWRIDRALSLTAAAGPTTRQAVPGQIQAETPHPVFGRKRPALRKKLLYQFIPEDSYDFIDRCDACGVCIELPLPGEGLLAHGCRVLGQHQLISHRSTPGRFQRNTESPDIAAIADLKPPTSR